MTSNRLWDTWMVAVGWILVVFGILLAFANQTRLFDVVFNNQVNTVFWSSPVAPESVVPFQRFIYGVLGMTVAGWGVFFIYVARYPFRRRERWAWTCIFAGITLWFIPDTAISAYFGVYVNVALNVTIAILVYVPLIATRRLFKNMSRLLRIRRCPPDDVLSSLAVLIAVALVAGRVGSGGVLPEIHLNTQSLH